MGVLLHPALRLLNAHIQQDLAYLLSRRLAMQVLMQGQRLADLFADVLQRVQAGHRVLQHHGDPAAADGKPLLFGGELRQILFLKEDGAGIHPAVLIKQAHEGLGQYALAGAGFAHDRQAFAPVYIQSYAADGVQHAPAQAELDV